MNSTDFVHLHTHSHYSLLDGLAKIDDLIDRCAELGMESLALTDHGTMYGVVEFYQKAKKKGIKPIIGVEVYIAPNGMRGRIPRVDDKRYHFILLAKNKVGYKNLIKLTSQAHLEGFYYKPRIDDELLQKHCEGLIGTSACLAGEISRKIVAKNLKGAERAALKYQKMFGPENFFLELEAHSNLENQDEINDQLIKMSKKLGIPLVAANDIHYIYKEDDTVQDILLCIQMGKQVSDKNRMSMMGENYSMKSPKEMIEHFKDVPEAIKNTQKIAERCNVELETNEYFIPKIDIPEGKTADSFLEEQCQSTIDKHYPNAKNIDEISKRLNYELGIIEKMGFASYFLIVADYVNWARENGVVVGPGRGSAAGSIVSFLLGITDMDPLKFNLLFERFLNPDRISMPDIDIDFADDGRDKVIEYVKNKYGEDQFAQIITFGTMAARGSIRDAGRVLGYPYAFCDKIAKAVPPMMKLKEALEKSPDLKKFYLDDPAAKKLLDSAKRLEGVARHSSTHACGVIITPDHMDNYVPRQYASQNDKTIISQYSMKYVESMGLVKMDFLGLANLTILKKALEIIHQEKDPDIELKNIPLDDTTTYQKIFQKGLTTGIFQFESSGMKQYLRMLKPTVFEDLISMAAMYRPGPLNSGMVDEFIARKNGKKEITYRHPSMKSALENTYGVIIYQEQVMQLSKDMAGFTGGQADVLRKAMGKKIESMMKEMGSKFVDGCVKNNIPKKIAEQTFDDMFKFSEYGFVRAHAACYALIGYQTAYLKTHYPTEFMAALLASDKDNLDRITIEARECKDMGIEILPPDINESFANFRVVKRDGKEAIRFGLEAIKNVGGHVVEEIVKKRIADGQYKSLTDFLGRVETKDLNKKSLESLAKAGALDNIGERNLIIENIETILQFIKETRAEKVGGQKGLFDNLSEVLPPARVNLKKVDPAPKRNRLVWEKELLGFYLSEHPLDEYREFLQKQTIPSSKIDSVSNGTTIVVGGIIQKVQKIITRTGKPMFFVPMEDAEGSFELIVFPNVAEEIGEIFEVDAIIMAKGKYSNKDGDRKILCDKAKVITQEDVNLFHQRNNIQTPDKIVIKVKSNTNLSESLNNIKALLSAQEKGNCQVILEVASKRIDTNFNIHHPNEFISILQKRMSNSIICSFTE